MFLEIHTTLIDKEKRYLNIENIIPKNAGECDEWAYNKDESYLEANLMYLQCVGGYVENKFAELNLYHRLKDGNVEKFTGGKPNISDPIAALFLETILKNPGILDNC